MNNMNPKLSVLISRISVAWMMMLLTCIYCCTLWATETQLSITQHRGFKQLRYKLQALVKAEDKKCVNHHFFAAKYPSDRNYTYLFWREGRALWILELGDGSSHHWESVLATPRSGTRINIDTDVVDDPGTSTYLVGSAWVKNIIYDTVLNGDLVVIKRNPERQGD